MGKVYTVKDVNVPDGAVYVGRGRTPSHLAPPPRWPYAGNPFKIGIDGNRQQVIKQFMAWIDGWVAKGDANPVVDIAGKDLVCWCAEPGKPLEASAAPDVCHAQYLLHLAQKEG